MGIHAQVVANGLHLRGFAGLPDGSAWLVDELEWPGAENDELVWAGDVDALPSDVPAAAGIELARRMLAAGAATLLREAEAMLARTGSAP